MPRTAIIDGGGNVINIVPDPLPDLLTQYPGCTQIADDSAEIGWRWSGGSFAAPAPAPRFVARDLLATLTPDDRIAIDRATRARDPVSGDLTPEAAQLTLLWEGLQAQGDAPIYCDSPRFLAGWAGLTAALGAARCAEIAAELGIPAP